MIKSSMSSGYIASSSSPWTTWWPISKQNRFMWRIHIKFIKCENDVCPCPFFPSAGLGTEVSVRIARNSAPPQVLTTFHTVPYSPEHIRNTTETFLRSTAETYRPSSPKRALPSLHTMGTTVTAWSPSTTPPSFSITTEVKGGGWYSCERSPKTLSLKRLSVFKMPQCSKKSVILCLNCKLYTNGFGRMRKTLKSLHLDEMELVGLCHAVPVLWYIITVLWTKVRVCGLKHSPKEVNKCWDQYLVVSNHLCPKGQEWQNTDRSSVTRIAWEDNDKQKSWHLRITIPCTSPTCDLGSPHSDRRVKRMNISTGSS